MVKHCLTENVERLHYKNQLVIGVWGKILVILKIIGNQQIRSMNRKQSL
jgi:hypothetical protein